MKSIGASLSSIKPPFHVPVLAHSLGRVETAIHHGPCVLCIHTERDRPAPRFCPCDVFISVWLSFFRDTVLDLSGTAAFGMSLTLLRDRSRCVTRGI